MLMPLQKRWVLLLKSPPPMMFDLILDVMNGFSAKIGSTVPLGRGYFPYHPRHFVPGYYRAVPPGQKTLDGRGFT
jgi:hypothetical protein